MGVSRYWSPERIGAVLMLAFVYLASAAGFFLMRWALASWGVRDLWVELASLLTCFICHHFVFKLAGDFMFILGRAFGFEVITVEEDIERSEPEVAVPGADVIPFAPAAAYEDYAAPLRPAPSVSVPQLELIPLMEWKAIVRNSRDGGANSILASHVLMKTAELLNYGKSQVEMMTDVANKVKEHATQLTSISEDIRQISNQSRLVSLNAAIEAQRAGEAGRIFSVVSQEMGNLANTTKQLTNSIDERLVKVNERIKANGELCETVAHLFIKVNRELGQFKNLMMRIEELSAQQTEKLRTVEDRGVVEKIRKFEG